MTKIITAVAAVVTLGLFALGSLVLGGRSDTTDAASAPAAPATAAIAAPAVVINVLAQVAVRSTPQVSVSGADSEDRTRLDEALAAFRENDLDLPNLDVRFFDDEAECHGHQGLFQQSFTPWRLLICSDLQFVPTHELAHAWEAATLTDDDRDRYVEARGLTTWDNPDVAWDERGVEDVAFILQQNLTTTNPPLTSATWIERAAAYELITGRPSPLNLEA
jgi:hypothetical protein